MTFKAILSNTGRLVAVCFLAFGDVGLFGQTAEKSSPGLAATFTLATDQSSDVAVLPNVWLYVAEGKSPTPFLDGGKFNAVWEGALAADLRGEFVFQAELNGSLKLEINGATAFEASGIGGASSLSRPVQLSKGANKLKATFASPTKGDAFVRLFWAEKAPRTGPIPNGLFSYLPTTRVAKAMELRLGRELFLDHRCAKCHEEKLAALNAPELSMDAPTFEGIGARRRYEWLAQWIHDPKAQQPQARMPKLIHGPNARSEAESIAAYLASLKTGGDVPIAALKAESKPIRPATEIEEVAPPAEEQKPLFERLLCIGCHDPPDAITTTKYSLKHVARKFPRTRLIEYLRQPEAHFAWTRMPNFKLTENEATELATNLLASALPANEAPAPSDPSLLEKGKKLTQMRGCLNCHTLKLENSFATVRLPQPGAAGWEKGCLAPIHDPKSAAPDFPFTAAERAALRAFGRSDRLSLQRHVPQEFAARETRLLNCTACHGQFEGFPPLEILGGKLKPEWTAAFIAGEVAYKPRADRHPKGEIWLEARMPAFKSRAGYLAEGMAAEHGYPPKTPAEPPIDMELAQTGQKLVGKDGGLSCISCHGAGKLAATEVFESEGINMAYSAERLLRPYYFRWMHNPLAIDPQTKMPAFFDEGKSGLTDIFEGDAEKQISAIWHYLRLGDKMPPPVTAE